jgi:hypothetical protein
LVVRNVRTVVTDCAAASPALTSATARTAAAARTTFSIVVTIALLPGHVVGVNVAVGLSRSIDLDFKTGTQVAAFRPFVVCGPIRDDSLPRDGELQRGTTA